MHLLCIYYVIRTHSHVSPTHSLCNYLMGIRGRNSGEAERKLRQPGRGKKRAVAAAVVLVRVLRCERKWFSGRLAPVRAFHGGRSRRRGWLSMGRGLAFLPPNTMLLLLLLVLLLLVLGEALRGMSGVLAQLVQATRSRTWANWGKPSQGGGGSILPLGLSLAGGRRVGPRGGQRRSLTLTLRAVAVGASMTSGPGSSGHGRREAARRLARPPIGSPGCSRTPAPRSVGHRRGRK